MSLSDGITAITCTGDRPGAFELCRRYMQRQTYRGLLQWIVVDDGEVSTSEQLPACAEQIRPEPFWKPGQNTMPRNLIAALAVVRCRKIVFIEDDDWYSPEYLDYMDGLLSQRDLAGEAFAHYYHVPTRQWRMMPNDRHASLCQTGITENLLGNFFKICTDNTDFLDVRLWEVGGGLLKRNVWPACVGIKGLPGRPGIGIGHRPSDGGHWEADPTCVVLRSWIGEDAANYASN